MARATYVPSSWFIVLTAMLCIGGAGWLGWLVADDDPPVVASDRPTVTSATPSAAPSATPDGTADPDDPDEAEPSPRTTREPTEPTPTPQQPAVRRDAPVSVLNNSGIRGAARTFSAKVAAAGWTVRGVGNWTGSIPSNTVYHPPGLQAQAALLARDVGIGRVLPSVAPMRTDGLTIILSGAQ